MTTGIALFAIGFLLTLSAKSDTVSGQNVGGRSGGNLADTRAVSSGSSWILLLGLVLGLAGLVVATAGPAAFFVLRKHGT
jgi:hypothetical protein